MQLLTKQPYNVISNWNDLLKNNSSKPIYGLVNKYLINKISHIHD